MQNKAVNFLGALDKLKNRINSIPKDFTYRECRSLLIKIGFVEYNKGATSGSRIRFYRESDKAVIDLHKPHPDGVLKHYMVKQIRDKLRETGDL